MLERFKRIIEEKKRDTPDDKTPTLESVWTWFPGDELGEGSGYTVWESKLQEWIDRTGGIPRCPKCHSGDQSEEAIVDIVDDEKVKRGKCAHCGVNLLIVKGKPPNE